MMKPMTYPSFIDKSWTAAVVQFRVKTVSVIGFQPAGSHQPDMRTAWFELTAHLYPAHSNEARSSRCVANMNVVWQADQTGH